MNSKGFTLIELLAMLVVLGILMAVSIPNITGILNNQKANAIVEDAVRMTDKVKTIVATDESISNPGVGECLIFTLDYLDLSGEIVKGPNYNYDRKQSFVILTRINNQYKYFVRLIESENNNYYGINLASLDDINKKNTNLVEEITVDQYNAINNDDKIPNEIVQCYDKNLRDYNN